MPRPERELIARIHRAAGAAGDRRIVRGIGDDAAVLRLSPDHDALVTTDFSLEGTHFRREWHPPEAIGHRALARGLSDIAAMGGEPVAAFLSLAMPTATPQRWVDRFFAGLLRLAREHHITLAGGDVSVAAMVVADVVVLGQSPRGGALLRSGAKAGDAIYVTGELGRSASVLQALHRGEHISATRQAARPHFFPEPRIAVGRYLREHGIATAAIDVSDGLSTDLSHICEESGVGAVIEADAVPRSCGLGVDLKTALHGGEDYELIFTARAKTQVPARISGVPVTRIGTITSDKSRRLWLADARGRRAILKPAGWQVF